MRFMKYLLAPVVVFALSGAVNAQPYYGDQGPGLIDQMERKVRTLAEDVPVEVRDGRGQALAAQAYDILDQIQHMRREAREVSPEHMREEAVEVDRKFHAFIEAAEALGPDGRYLARSAERVEDLDHELMQLPGGAAQPTYPQPPVVQPAPTVYQRTYVVPGYQTYPQGTAVYQRGGLTIYFRR